jgi:hypothetical protein
MKLLLIINGLIEAIVGLVFIFSPETMGGVLKGENTPQFLLMVRMYGFAALALGIFSFQLMSKSHEQELVISGFFMFFLFHTFIAISQFWNIADKAATTPAGILHLLLAIGFLFFYWKEVS